MKICFVLPKFTRQPIGGYKMVFEYANRLINLGHEVYILFLNEGALNQFRIPKFLKRCLSNILTEVQPKWFDLDRRVKKLSSLSYIYRRKLNNIDVCIATSVDTVEKVLEIKSSKKLYFIQDYENWWRSDEYVRNTYSLEMTNIVISDWLKRIVEIYSKKSVNIIKNPIDLDIYKAYNSLFSRKKHSIALLYHEAEHKGVKYAFQALGELKKIYPDLTVEMFGIFTKPKCLPEWINYTKGASQKQTVDIYNMVEVFLCASVEEGYGLTGLEAMACGAVLVSTSYRGVLEYAENEVNALLSPVTDVKSLVMNVSEIFNDENKRFYIAQNGIKSAKKFSWSQAMSKFNKIIEG